MTVVNVTLPSDGTSANVADYNDPINVIVAIMNGGLNDDNISGLSGTKITAGTLPDTALTAAAKKGWVTGATVPTTITHLGNRSYSLAYASSILTYKSVGARNRYIRSVTTQTQVANLTAASSHFFSRASGSMTGMTFTGNHTTMAWVKLTAYPASGSQIIGRNDNATGGFSLGIATDGRARAFYGAASVFTDFFATVGIPLNKWVHIACSVNAAAKTCVFLYDGIVQVTTSALTAATTVAQTSNFEIGRIGANYMSFKIAQAAVFSTNVATATLLGYMNQGITGAESNMVCGYSFNNSLNDLTANANTLTANNGVLATNLDAPFGQGGSSLYHTAGTVEHSITTMISADGLTETVQVPEGSTLPTTGGISQMDYSYLKAPYGMPIAEEKWTIFVINKVQASNTSAPTVNVWYNLTVGNNSIGFYLTVPIGEWTVGYQVVGQSNGVSPLTYACTLSTANNTEIDAKWTSYGEMSGANGSGACQMTREHGLSLTTATPYYLNTKYVAAGPTQIYNRGEIAETIIKAKLALL